MSTIHRFFVTGHKGFETALFHEIRDLVGKADQPPQRLSKVYGGVEVDGHIELAYRVCLHSRLANRVYLQLAVFKADNEESLYQQVYAVDWSLHLGPRHSFAVSASLSRSMITHSHFASLKVKDAVVDFFRNTVNSRPSIETRQPDLRIHLNLHKNRATLSLDLSGESLHRRGYRLQHSGAPLKEHLAAALLSQAGWTAEAVAEHSLIDPMCGSGTFVIEAAMIAAGIAPGVQRNYFGFLRWLQHDHVLWQQLVDEARAMESPPRDCQIIGCDSSGRALDIARENAERAGVGDLIHFQRQEIADLSPGLVSKPAIIITNPPYGERLQAEQGLAQLYSTMGKVFGAFEQASVHVISANPDLLHRMRLARSAKKAVNNGPIACVFASFDSGAGNAQPPPASLPALDESDNDAQSLSNRLAKNYKHLSRWARRSDVTCFRLYDADLPEFSFALDVYQSAIDPDQRWFHLQEYQAPKTVDADKAAQRLQLAQKVIRRQFELPESALFVKTRQRQRGAAQYAKQASEGELLAVREGQARLLINLTDYLDSGLFLDHRITRQWVADRVQGRSLLNLFCYTGSVSVQAALAGASRVVSADMSKTYLHWARENFELNDLVDETRYRFIEADCLALLDKPRAFDLRETFDVIFLDPPSFSNSKKMRDTLDVQRDHRSLIEQAMGLLKPSGTLLFSTNRKGFRLDDALLQRYQVEDITPRTVSEDFKRRPRIHLCWEISHRQ